MYPSIDVWTISTVNDRTVRARYIYLYGRRLDSHAVVLDRISKEE